MRSASERPTFLEELAEAVMARPDAATTLVVLPSTRAASRFRKACARALGTAGWLPRTTTLNALLQSCTGLRPVDALEGLAYLYQAYREVLEAEEGEDRIPGFANFAPWGRVVLRDFNELDHYLTDVDDVLQNLLDIEGVKAWEPDQPLHEGSRQFLRQCGRLAPLYHRFRAQLEPLGRGTTGYVARQAATRADLSGLGPVVVAGMAALTPAEQGFLLRLHALGRLTLYADADPAYVWDNAIPVEAGGFLRDWDPALPVQPLRSRLVEHPPQLHYVACSSGVFECQWAAHTLRTELASDVDDTVLVLPDGGQLSMLLQSLDGMPDGVNVTMGLAWSESPVAGFFEAAMRLAETGRSWRHADVTAFLGHPLAVSLHAGTGWTEAVGQWLRQSAEHHWTWVTPDRVAAHAPDLVRQALMDLVPLGAPDADGFLAGLQSWAEAIEQRLDDQVSAHGLSEGDVNPWLRAGWKRLVAATAGCARFQAQFQLFSTAKDVRDLLFQTLNAERLDLQGEPEKGLQVMGLIETRALDFKRVVVLDCNEGVLPQTALDDSLIPFDLRRALKPRMPTRHQREAIYAYYLYRLLQRAEEVYLVYRANDEEREPSRYILQLQHSFRPGGKLLPQDHRMVNLPMQTDRPAIPSIAWTPWATERLQRWGSHGISPSAVNTWFECPRKFYYQYIVGIREPKEVEDAMTASIFGSVVHHVLEHGLKPREGMVLRPEDFQALIADLDHRLDDAVRNKYNAELVSMGVNHLQLAIAKATLDRSLRVEWQEVKDLGSPVTLLGVEIPLMWEGEWPEPVGKLRFAGTADRITRIENEVTVTDYKTGKVEAKELGVRADWQEQLAGGKFPKALQLLMYGAIARKWLDAGAPTTATPNAEDRNQDPHRWLRGLPQGLEVTASIRSTRQPKSGALSLSIEGLPHIQSPQAQAFFDWLAAEIRRIHDDAPDIAHHPEAMYCPYCVVLDPLERPF